MSKLVRFLSRRRTGKGIKRGVHSSDPKKKKHVVDCTVVLLDDTDVSIELPVSKILLDKKAEVKAFSLAKLLARLPFLSHYFLLIFMKFFIFS